MASRRRITPFARFFIFLLIAAPTALIVAMLVRGEEMSLQGVKNAITNTDTQTEQPGIYPIGDDQTTTLPIEQQAIRQPQDNTTTTPQNPAQAGSQNGVQMIEFRSLQAYVENLEKRILQLEKELESVKREKRLNE
jgi:hypothetical protein